MKTLKKQWLEAVGAYQVLTFLFMGETFFFLVFSLLFTPLWSFSVLYLSWLFLDWDTSSQGGRRSEWIRNWAIWKHLRDYYFIKLVKMMELPPDQNYVFGSHPGIMCIGTFYNFSIESNSSQKFPGLWPSIVGLASLFHFPIHRDYETTTSCPMVSLQLRIFSMNRQSLDFILLQPQLGQAMVIVGGAQELLYAIPGEHHLILQNHKGFVLLALRHRALVLIYSFGVNDIFRLKFFATDSWQYLCQTTFKKLIGIASCIFCGHCLFSANSWGLLPFPVPVTIAVGHPIPLPQCLHPTEKEVDHYHMLYMKALEQLFEKHKESCGIPASTHLTLG
ncbi:LOW QUALITY PROTEIN: 2-acylglycerol O-acyltransferase 3 [Hipposideros larvatus]